MRRLSVTTAAAGLGPDFGEARRAEVVREGRLIGFVLQAVSLSTGVCPREIAARTRQTADAAQARQIVMYLLHTAWAWPLARVAAGFGRDRSTASYACQRVEDLRDDKGFDAQLSALEACVRMAPLGDQA